MSTSAPCLAHGAALLITKAGPGHRYRDSESEQVAAGRRALFVGNFVEGEAEEAAF